MPLFRCDKCGCVENTACCNYWARERKDEPKLCSECDPESAEWHGRFEKRSADGMLIDQNGHLWSRESVEAGQLPQAYRIVGEVMSNCEVTRGASEVEESSGLPTSR